jgi:hypothetical protein
MELTQDLIVIASVTSGKKGARKETVMEKHDTRRISGGGGGIGAGLGLASR